VEPLHAELAILARREELLALRREELVLRAPSDGEVREVLVRPGEVVSPGSPVLTLVALGGPRVHVCMGEAQAEEVRLGESTLLYPRGRDASRCRGTSRRSRSTSGNCPSVAGATRRRRSGVVR
jgi:multidrug resistance efflux pump